MLVARNEQYNLNIIYKNSLINARAARQERMQQEAKLPPLSIYNSFNKFSVLHVDPSKKDNLIKTCDECGVYIHPDFNHSCIITTNNKIVFKKINIKNSFYCRFRREHFPASDLDFSKRRGRVIKERPRNISLLLRLKYLINCFRLYRISLNNRYIKFNDYNLDFNLISNNKCIYNIIDKFKNLYSEENKDLHEMSAVELCNLGTVPYYDPFVEAQMDNEVESPHGDCDLLIQEQKENVILTTHAEESVAQPITISGDNWEKLCSPQSVQEYRQLMSRWQQFKTFEWSKDDYSGTMKFDDLVLPFDFVRSNLKSPNCLPFNQYSFFRSDMEVKIVINTNKFHCGSLQFSFYYGANMDKHYKDRSDIYSASQMTHCIVDAASATDGILKIPFRYYKPLLATSSRKDDAAILNLGNLRCFVLNQLQVAKDDTQKVSVNLFLRFVEPSFHGMKPIDLKPIEGQMFSSSTLKDVVNTTARMVNQVFPDPQRDNPTDVIPPKPMVPWSAHSWCIGDVCPEPLNPLRLQASGSATHPPGTLPKEPEMDISYITSIFGLAAQQIWRKSDPVGTILKRIPFSPVWQWDSYYSKNLNNGESRRCSVLPPVSVMAELFAYWRGSMEYRFDFIATQFHTGRLIIAYLPRIDVGNNITITQLTACDHVIVDLRNERQVSYICSYLSDKPWWPRRKASKNSAELLPPGYIYIAVFNPLQVTQNISSNIEINIYMRAGKDFELHVPVNPQIGLSYNTKLIPVTSSLISYLPNYGPVNQQIYVGQWHTVSNRIVFRYGPTSDHVTQFSVTDAKKKLVFTLDTPSIKILNPQTGVELKYLCLFSDGTYAYGAPMSTLAVAKAFNTSLTVDALMTDQALAYMTQSDKEGDYLDVHQRMYWKVVAEEVESQAGEERSTVCGEVVNVQSNVNSTWNGLLTFGEQITSLKQLCRRYAPYGQYVASATTKNVDPSIADFAFPVLPQGLDLVLNRPADNKEHVYGNRIRDGPIAIIASGYRFYRGSMRFRAVVTGKEDGVFWVQHRPEYSLHHLSVFQPNKNYVDAVFQPGYAYMVQLSQMNNVVEFEVPFYLPGQFGMLQRPNLLVAEDAVHYSMGTIYCGFDTMKGTPADVPYFVQLFSSIGDDMTFSVFQGYPPMIDLSVYNETVQAQGPVDWLSSRFESIGTKVGTNILTSALTERIPNTEASTSGTSPLGKDGNIVQLVQNLLGEVSAEKQQVIVSLISNLVHSIIHPSVTQIAWSIASIFIQLGVLTLNILDKFVNVCKSFISSFDRLVNRSKKSKSDTVVADGPEDEEDLKNEAAFVSTCVAGMLAAIGATTRPLPTSLPNFAKYIYEGLPKFSLTANGLFTFLKNNLRMFKKVWYWLVSYFNSDYMLYAELDGSTEEVILYIKRIQWCLDARNRDTIENDPKASLQVYELANIAQSFLAKRITSKVQKNLFVFDYYCKKIITLRDDLTSKFKSPAIRFEPFVICLQGPSNVGKSHLANKLARDLLDSIDFKSYGELVYTRTPGNAYWNGLSSQPVLMFDDFLNIEDSMHSLTQIGELFCLKSKAVFNPPMAAIEEKRIRYNPLIVFLLCNQPFPKIPGLALDEAWFRRRDVMYNVLKKDEFKGIHPRSLPNKIKATYGHLAFNQYGDTSDPKSKLMWTQPKEYNEFLPGLIKQFKEYFDEECIQYDNAVQEVRRFYPDAALTNDDYLAQIEEKIKTVNNARIPQGDLVEIQKQMMALRENQFTADMTTYVQRKILDKKVNELTTEQQLRQNVCNVVTSPVTSSTVCANVTPLTIVANSDEESSVAFKVNNETVEIVDKVKCFPTSHREVAQIFKRLMGFTKECDCLYPLAMMQDYYAADDINAVGEIRYTDLAESRFSEMYRKSYMFRPCGEEECCMLETEAMQKCYQHYSFIWERFIKERMPPIMQEFKKVVNVESYTPDTIPYMTPDQVDICIQKEINDKAWYAKLWESLPSWGTIFSYLAKLTIIFGAIGTLIRMAGYLVGSPDASEAKIVEAKAEKMRAHNQLDWFTDQSKHGAMEGDASNYSTGTIGAKAHPSVVVKAIANASQQEETIQSRIIRNTFWLSAEYDSNGVRNHRMFRCLGLCGSYYLLLDHYVYFLCEQSNLVLHYVRDGCAVLVPNSILRVERLENSAICIGKMHTTIPHFANIIKFFVRSHMTGNLSPSASLYEYVYNGDKKGFVMNRHTFNRIGRRSHLEVCNDNNSYTSVSDTYIYDYGGRGVCCSVLATNMNTPTPIIGIHIAGKSDGSEGYSEAITYESFAPLLNRVAAIVQENSAHSTILKDTAPIMFLDGNVVQHGVIPRSEAMYPPSSTRLIPTECVGAITPVTYDVPVLNSKDERIADDPFSPLLEGCMHHTNPCLPFTDSFVQNAIEDVRAMILSQCQPQRFEVGKLSIEQSVCGLLDNPLYEAMAMDTSEGFPWQLRRPPGVSNKSWLFDRELTSNGWKLVGIDKELEDTLNRKDEMRRNGEYPETVFVDCLKDAKLPKEKVLDRGKTRIFSISPVDFTIQQRQYSLDFSVSYTQARFNVESGVGMDIYSIEAHNLVERMLEFSPYFVCADYSKFGDQLYAELIQAVYRIIADWYEYHGVKDDKFRTVLTCFGYEVSYAFHLMLNQLYQCFGGMPSGNPLTVIINSIVNSMYVRIVWQEIMVSTSLRHITLKQFSENVRVVCYGDDLWLSIKKEVLDDFNAQTMSECFKQYGIRFTNAVKYGEMAQFTTIDEVETSFLKCTFVRHPIRSNLWMAKLDQRAVEEICNWTWKTNRNVRESSIEACDQMLLLAYGHGPSYYESLRNKVVTFWRDKGVFFVSCDWYSLDIQHYGVE